MPAIVIEDTGLNYTSSSSFNFGSSHHLSTYNSPSIQSFSPPSVRNLLAVNGLSSDDEQSQNIYQNVHSIFDDIDFNDIIGDNDDDLFGSPLAFDASENGLWNGRFVPPPPRPPFMDDILSDGVTTCDLCSWAMPTKSTFIFEGTIEKATELGWPLTLIIVSIISAILGAIVMVTIVRCKRKKSTNNRNETHVQWWSRNKRTNNQLRRSNIYTAHPADSIRGLQTNTMESCNWPNVTTIVVNS